MPLRLLPWSYGARRSRRFNVQKHAVLKIPSPLELCILKRCERRAPLALFIPHSNLRASINRSNRHGLKPEQAATVRTNGCL
jgi:hypothetical protein